MRKSKLRAALFLAHLRLELAVTARGWEQYMCLTTAGSFWLARRSERRAVIRELNRKFVEESTGKKAANDLQGDVWGSTPVFYVKMHYINDSNELAGTPKYHLRILRNTDLEHNTRKALFQYWKKNLLETGL